MLGPAAGKTFAVDVAACTISIGSALSIVTTGGNGLSTTISYTKSGGGTGTLTFTQGILTGST
ncbi:MAG: hypothetical protein LAQ30_04335 [Acidobacteriia bacterium]|nr:hypothetical protein [Terriglobia bacterium]